LEGGAPQQLKEIDVVGISTGISINISINISSVVFAIVSNCSSSNRRNVSRAG